MSELEEVRRLLQQASYPGVINALQQHEKLLLSQETSQNQQHQHQHQHQQDRQVEDNKEEKEKKKAKTVPLKEDVRVAAPVASSDRVVYTPITDFAWDQNGYDSPIVSVYVDLPDVGTVKDQVTCNFTSSSFDFQVMGLNGKNYRLLKDNLDKDIEPEKSKILIKKNKVVIKLHKVKGQYSYESWTNLTSKKSADKRKASSKDPSAGIMDMMKDMYDEGDDNMKKIIGEAMMKSRSGEKMDPPSMPSMDGL